MTLKNVDDLTLDEIKEQMALFQRLYYRKKKETDPAFMERNRELGRAKYYRKKERIGAEPKSREKYDSKNLLIVEPATTD